MRRLVAILLLLTLPLQAIWGAAEPYCQHEQGSAAHHVGHHVHDHEASDADAKTPAKAKALSMADHGDHCCSAWTLVPAALSMPEVHEASQASVGTVAALSSVDPGRIERPNWPFSL
jgi:hypothetical protein